MQSDSQDTEISSFITKQTMMVGFWCNHEEWPQDYSKTSNIIKWKNVLYIASHTSTENECRNT